MTRTCCYGLITGSSRTTRAARAWWADTLSTVQFVGLPWTVILAFLRVSTHARAFTQPLSIEQAWQVVAGWLSRTNVGTTGPTDRHARILEDMLVLGAASANHTSDAHLAALSIEHGLELQSADRDFARYPGLRWRNPLLGSNI
ncbi:MAG TPA: TA system VapC family ribonuclease toxin [Dehalococcoidia bacterium]|nr:TA system VapC family ribonuclease toxin [Dehalococcoidia bacterium]